MRGRSRVVGMAIPVFLLGCSSRYDHRDRDRKLAISCTNATTAKRDMTPAYRVPSCLHTSVGSAWHPVPCPDS